MTGCGDDMRGPDSSGSLFARLRATVAGIDAATRWAVIAAMAVMATLVVVQVVFRYVFSSAIDWSAEVARLAFVWAIFLAIPHGIRRGVHVGIDAVVVCFPFPAQIALFRLSCVMVGVLMAVVFWFALQVTIDSWSEMMPTLPLTAALYYVAVLISALHSLLHLCLLAWGGPQTWAEEAAA